MKWHIVFQNSNYTPPSPKHPTLIQWNIDISARELTPAIYPRDELTGIMSPTLIDTLFLNNLPSANKLTRKKKSKYERIQ